MIERNAVIFDDYKMIRIVLITVIKLSFQRTDVNNPNGLFILI
jgi:hypothetical protein